MQDLQVKDYYLCKFFFFFFSIKIHGHEIFVEAPSYTNQHLAIGHSWKALNC
jgi:hypothetical protein